jgi:hypothetical protein
MGLVPLLSTLLDSESRVAARYATNWANVHGGREARLNPDDLVPKIED